MDAVAVSAAAQPRRLLDATNPRAVSARALSASVVVYLGLAHVETYAELSVIGVILLVVSVAAQNWSNWLTLSRLEAEDGHARASLRAYRQARALNPRSPIFQ